MNKKDKNLQEILVSIFWLLKMCKGRIKVVYGFLNDTYDTNENHRRMSVDYRNIRKLE